MNWWISISDTARPEGQRFVGAIILPGPDPQTAVLRRQQLGPVPGVEDSPTLECRCAGIPKEIDALIGDEWRGRLLTLDECKAFDREIGRKGLS